MAVFARKRGSVFILMLTFIKKLVREKPYSKILLYYIFYLTGFVILEHTVTAQYIIHCPLDDKIPFCEWFLIAYSPWMDRHFPFRKKTN